MAVKKNTALVMEQASGSISDLVELDFSRQSAQQANGQTEQTYGMWGVFWRFSVWCHSRKGCHTFRKKIYLWLILFTGWFGGHRYYQGRYVLGILYSLFFWTGVPFVSCVFDAMEAIPMKADEKGLITL
ncbi:MAG: TM2 domain-containing protein [Lachnospiraceae bacterium]|nr:TM2 domain-containing protein [Lachnospiraceae bacterium]